MPDFRDPSRPLQDFRGALYTPPDHSKNYRGPYRLLPTTPGLPGVLSLLSDFRVVLSTSPGLHEALPTPPGLPGCPPDLSRYFGGPSRPLPDFWGAFPTFPDTSQTSGVPS